MTTRRTFIQRLIGAVAGTVLASTPLAGRFLESRETTVRIIECDTCDYRPDLGILKVDGVEYLAPTAGSRVQVTAREWVRTTWPIDYDLPPGAEITLISPNGHVYPRPERCRDQVKWGIL